MAKRRRILTPYFADSARTQPRARQRGRRMAWLVVAGLALILLGAAALLLFRSAPALPDELTAMQAFEKYRAGALFLDVRSEAEWNQGHIANSLLIPLDQLSARLSELPRDRELVVVCWSGARSQEAAAILRAAGYARVTGLSGGLERWIAAGYPVED